MRSDCTFRFTLGSLILSFLLLQPCFSQSSTQRAAMEEKRALQREMYDLARIGDDIAFAQLGEYAVAEDPEKRKMAAYALGRSKHGDTFELLTFLIDDENRNVRAAAALSLGYLKDERAYKILLDLLEEDESSEVKGKAVYAMGAFVTEDSFNKVVESIESNLATVRKNAVNALGRTKDKRAIEPLIGALKDNEDAVREGAKKSLKRLTGEDKLYSETRYKPVEESYKKWKQWWEKNKDTFEIAKSKSIPSRDAKDWLREYDADKNGGLDEKELQTGLDAFFRMGKTIKKGDILDTGIEVKKIDGAEAKLPDLLTGPTLIYYFDVNCKYCRKAEGFVKELSAASKDKEINFIGIASPKSSLKQLEGYLERSKFEFPVISDHKREFAVKNHISSWPTILIIDKSGKIQEYYRGLSASSRDKITEALAKCDIKK